MKHILDKKLHTYKWSCNWYHNEVDVNNSIILGFRLP